MKLIRGRITGNNEERLANYFETGATFALFQRNLHSIRRLLIALISHLPKKEEEEEAFWQWYPAYGYQFPHYNTMSDKAGEIHANYDDWEVPFTSADIPEGYFTEKPEPKRDQPKTIPVVPDFVPAARPINKKPEYPAYLQSCAKASPEEPTRAIADDWLYTCWNTKHHAHGYYTCHLHRPQEQEWMVRQGVRRGKEQILKIEVQRAAHVPKDRTPNIHEILQEDEPGERRLQGQQMPGNRAGT
eukprot:1990494-Amphidinium_carterae.1